MDKGYKFISDSDLILNLPKFFQNVLTGANLSRPAWHVSFLSEVVKQKL